MDVHPFPLVIKLDTVMLMYLIKAKLLAVLGLGQKVGVMRIYYICNYTCCTKHMGTCRLASILNSTIQGMLSEKISHRFGKNKLSLTIYEC